MTALWTARRAQDGVPVELRFFAVFDAMSNFFLWSTS
jgi:hypothetical protein